MPIKRLPPRIKKRTGSKTADNFLAGGMPDTRRKVKKPKGAKQIRRPKKPKGAKQLRRPTGGKKK